MTQTQIKYDNNLSLIESLSTIKFFEYLKSFKNILNKLNKVNILKSSNYNINLPVETEINLLIKYEKKNETSNIIALLMRLIKPVRSSFKLDYGKLIAINLNNGSKCFVRLLLFEQNIKNIISTKHLTNISDIYHAYQSEYPYINENFINFEYKINDDDNDILSVFNDLLHVNKHIYDLCFEHNNVNYYNIKKNELEYIDKKLYKNIDTVDKKSNVKTNINNIDITTRMHIFNEFITNIKKTNMPEYYIDTVLNDLRKHADYNLFIDSDDDLSKKKKKKINDLLFNKLSPLVSFILILQPFSLCDVSYMLFSINDEFNLLKKTQYDNNDDSYNISAKNNNNINNTFTAQKIILNISDYIVNNNINDINDIVHDYTVYFDNDEQLANKIVWMIIVSYHIESILYDSKFDYKKINIDNIISYVKLFGIKQYSKGDFYKKRIEWIFKLFSEDKNSELLLPNLFKYCRWIIMDNDKNDFLMNLYNDDECDSDTPEIDINH